jgi:hypothetical protein
MGKHRPLNITIKDEPEKILINEEEEKGQCP